MNDIFKPTGATPFELAEARLASGQAQVKAAEALSELIKTLEECDIMINMWRDELQAGKVDPETRMLAAQALKDRHVCHDAIEKLSAFMSKHFTIEA